MKSLFKEQKRVASAGHRPGSGGGRRGGRRVGRAQHAAPLRSWPDSAEAAVREKPPPRLPPPLSRAPPLPRQRCDGGSAGGLRAEASASPGRTPRRHRRFKLPRSGRREAAPGRPPARSACGTPLPACPAPAAPPRRARAGPIPSRSSPRPGAARSGGSRQRAEPPAGPLRRRPQRHGGRR